MYVKNEAVKAGRKDEVQPLLHYCSGLRRHRTLERHRAGGAYVLAVHQMVVVVWSSSCLASTSWINNAVQSQYSLGAGNLQCH